MSGRSRVTLADGRRVRGFRKTLRRNPRSAVRPEWRLVLILPPTIMVSPGPHGYGVNVTTGEKDAVLLDVKTFSIDEAVQRAGDFLHRYARHLAPLSIVATITSPGLAGRHQDDALAHHRGRHRGDP